MQPAPYLLLPLLAAVLDRALGQLTAVRPGDGGEDASPPSAGPPNVFFTTVKKKAKAEAAEKFGRRGNSGERDDRFDSAAFNELQKGGKQLEPRAVNEYEERISHRGLDKYECGDRHKVCDYDESCERLCFWDEYSKDFVGCKVACVKRRPDVRLDTYQTILPLPYISPRGPVDVPHGPRHTGGDAHRFDRREVFGPPPQPQSGPGGTYRPHGPPQPYEYEHGHGHPPHGPFDGRQRHGPHDHAHLPQHGPRPNGPHGHSHSHHGGGPPHQHVHSHRPRGQGARRAPPPPDGPVLPDAAYHNTCSSSSDCGGAMDCCYYRQCGYRTQYEHEHECTVTKRCLRSCQPHAHQLPFGKAKKAKKS